MKKNCCRCNSIQNAEYYSNCYHAYCKNCIQAIQQAIFNSKRYFSCYECGNQMRSCEYYGNANGIPKYIKFDFKSIYQRLKKRNRKKIQKSQSQSNLQIILSSIKQNNQENQNSIQQNRNKIQQNQNSIQQALQFWQHQKQQNRQIWQNNNSIQQNQGSIQQYQRSIEQNQNLSRQSWFNDNQEEQNIRINPRINPQYIDQQQKSILLWEDFLQGIPSINDYAQIQEQIQGEIFKLKGLVDQLKYQNAALKQKCGITSDQKQNTTDLLKQHNFAVDHNQRQIIKHRLKMQRYELQRVFYQRQNETAYNIQKHLYSSRDQPLVVLMKSEYNKKFGFCIHKQLPRPNQNELQILNDSQSCIFSLQSQHVYRPKNNKNSHNSKNNRNIIYYGNGDLIAFGADMQIKKNYHLQKNTVLSANSYLTYNQLVGGPSPFKIIQFQIFRAKIPKGMEEKRYSQFLKQYPVYQKMEIEMDGNLTEKAIIEHEI